MSRPSHLIHVSGDEPGFSRKRRGKGFEYFNEKGKKIQSSEIIDRIKQLVIPPAWSKVWICPEKNGYVQATGIDAKNRKQYIYHPDWSNYRQEEKFDRMLSFGNYLPEISEKYTADLRKHNWPKEKVIALIIYLLDNYYFRIGNMRYTNQNQSYGLTTLRKKHIQKGTGKLLIRYKAKSGKLRKVTIENKTIAKKIRQISELQGYEIFHYLDDDGQSKKIDSGDINDYLYGITGGDFTAKDFRTWGASKLAFEFYEEACEALKNNPRLKFETTLIKKIAKAIGNTVSTCRKYYVHPGAMAFLTDQHPSPLQKIFPANIQVHESLDEFENYLLYTLSKKI